MLAIVPLLGGALGRGDEEKPVVRLEAPVENELTALVQNVRAPDGGGDYTTRFSGEWERL